MNKVFFVIQLRMLSSSTVPEAEIDMLFKQTSEPLLLLVEGVRALLSISS